MKREPSIAVGDEIRTADGVSVVASLTVRPGTAPETVATLVDRPTVGRTAARPVQVPVRLIAFLVACGEATVVPASQPDARRPGEALGREIAA